MEFKNVLQGQYKTAQKQVVHEHFPEPTDLENVPVEQDCSSEANFCHAVELFITKVLHEKKPQDWQYIYMMPGGDHNIQKKIKTSPLNHLHQWEEMMHITGLLPKGNIPMPNKQLQVEWFYMTFHMSDRVEYVRSGRKLSNKMLQTIVEYFQSIHKTRENNGSLTRHQIEKVQAEAKHKLCHKLEEQMGCKQRLLSDQCRGYRLYNQRDDGGHHRCQHGQQEQRKLRGNGSCGNDKSANRKSPPKRKDKDFKPSRIHGKHTNTRTKSAVPTHAIKQNCAQTTTSAGTKVAITMSIATQVARMSCARLLILPCPAMAMQAQAMRAKLKRTFT
jgi:hypothetical protein